MKTHANENTMVRNLGDPAKAVPRGGVHSNTDLTPEVNQWQKH